VNIAGRLARMEKTAADRPCRFCTTRRRVFVSTPFNSAVLPPDAGRCVHCGATWTIKHIRIVTPLTKEPQ
jgi:hypothetical protein